MAEIIKTWPAFLDARKAAQIFSPRGCFARYYFSLGRGRPKQAPDKVWFTYRGRILGWFAVEKLVVNDGSLPAMRSLSGEESGWQLKRDAWVAVCIPGCHRLRERIFMEGFRGWRYFNLDAYRESPDARFRM